MKKAFILSSLAVLSLASLASCGGRDTSKVIAVCASESPHALILNNAVKPLLEEKGYRLEVTVLDWTLQNDAVLNGDYDKTPRARRNRTARQAVRQVQGRR